MAILNEQHPRQYFWTSMLYAQLVPEKRGTRRSLRSATGGQYDYESVKTITEDGGTGTYMSVKRTLSRRCALSVRCWAVKETAA